MQLGKSLAGALIGGILGIALCLAIYFATGGWDRAWLAIPVAILTGLGVRWMVETRGHPSYARGALTAVIAVAAFLAFYPIAAMVTTRGTAARPITAQAAPQQDAGKANEDAGDAPAETAAPVVPVRNEEGRGGLVGPVSRNQRPPERSPLEYVALGLAAFIAYELGRGSGAVKPTPGVTTPDDEPAAAPLHTVPPPD
jgi:hypothetical protein